METKFDRAKYMASQHIEGYPLLSTNQAHNELDRWQSGAGRHHGLDEQFKKKSRLATLKPIEHENLRGKNQLVKLIICPILLLLFPINSYSNFIYDSNIVWLSFLNATESRVLCSKPYKMSTSTVGLTFIAPLAGTTTLA
ncbi:hypothetical protein N0V84_008021 [Fusarium piperis]|uniref:Uncharacterized protein n=1 Tax=Fusarium piperis TaxID=1435070 RepID=A0A9W8W8W0_9HYPO|nr:hypothetical protein N0V84_008021 [Fusarium piperis]